MEVIRNYNIILGVNDSNIEEVWIDINQPPRREIINHPRDRYNVTCREPQIDQAIFQKDSVPLHLANPDKRLLNNNLHGCWIGRRSKFLEWPPDPQTYLCVISFYGVT
ncbi:hypothetical protein J6590_063312 [Homalodisca vitripennis]|nr:hypothetical protein J6590_063312 [Homalodisca vitripennis]